MKKISFSSFFKKKKKEPEHEDNKKDSIDILKENISKISDVEFNPIKEDQVKENTDDPSANNSYKFKFIRNDKYLSIVIYGLIFVLFSILIYKLIGDLSITSKAISAFFSLLGPFITGAFIALILYPLVKLIYRNFFTNLLHIKSAKLKKILSILLAYIIAIGFIAILLGFVIPQIYFSLQEIIDKLPVWYDNTYDFIINFEDKHSYWTFINFDDVNNYIQSLLPRLTNYLTGILSNMIPYLVNTSMAIMKGLVNFIIAIIVSIYMISDHKNLFYHTKRALYGTLPKKTADSFRIIVRNCVNIFLDFIFGKALDSLIIGILCFIIMSILKMPYSVLISVIVGVTNMIPYFGPYIGGVIGGLFIIIANPVLVIGYAILILVIQQLDGLVIGPKIIGDSTGLKPLWVIFGITVGGSLWGILGMFLGVPIVAVLGYILNLIVQNLLNKKRVKIKPYDSFDEF